MRRLQARLAAGDPEAGLTLIELLIASAMSVIIVGAACLMLISAVQDQPKLSRKAQEISTARYVLERMTRELRNGIQVFPGATGSRIEFETQVRRVTCGGATQGSASAESIPCRVTYACAPVPPDELVTCTRTETAPEVSGSSGTPEVVVSGLDSDDVFTPEPSTEPTYVGIRLSIANPEGRGALTVTDGAGLRTASFREGIE